MSAALTASIATTYASVASSDRPSTSNVSARSNRTENRPGRPRQRGVERRDRLVQTSEPVEAPPAELQAARSRVRRIHDVVGDGAVEVLCLLAAPRPAEQVGDPGAGPRCGRIQPERHLVRRSRFVQVLVAQTLERPPSHGVRERAVRVEFDGSGGGLDGGRVVGEVRELPRPSGQLGRALAIGFRHHALAFGSSLRRVDGRRRAIVTARRAASRSIVRCLCRERGLAGLGPTGRRRNEGAVGLQILERLVRCGRERQVHAERCSAAVAVLDPGASAVQLGEACDEREADADARVVRDDLVPLAERLEDGVAELLGDRPVPRPPPRSARSRVVRSHGPRSACRRACSGSRWRPGSRRSAPPARRRCTRGPARGS